MGQKSNKKSIDCFLTHSSVGGGGGGGGMENKWNYRYQI